MDGNRLVLLISTDDLRPAAGDALNFDLTAVNDNTAQSGTTEFVNLIDDINIRVELSAGLEFKEGWSPPAEFVKSGRSATWRPEAVDVKADLSGRTALVRPDSRDIQIQTQLTSDSLADIPLEERCITAWVAESTPPPSPHYVLGSLTQCLGDDPPVLFQSGQMNLFTLYPCAGATTVVYPCRDEDGTSGLDNGLELVATVSNFNHPALRAYGVGRSDADLSSNNPKVRLRPKAVVIQVKDPKGRVVDGSSVTWQTGGGDTDFGVSLYHDVELLANTGSWMPGQTTNTGTPDWSNEQNKVSATGVDGQNKPGTLSIRYQYCDPNDAQYCHNEVTNADNTSFTSATDIADQYGTYSYDIFYEMGALGTYSVTRTHKSSYDGSSPSVVHEASANFVIHVGPIAELEARDGGTNPAVLAGQRAFTVVAVNNGPDIAPAAKVTVTGLDATTCTGTATKGSLAFASSECTWTIGELKTKEISQIQNGRDGEILTIITTAAVDTEITAAISNTEDYQVCIDSSGNDVDAASESACTGTTGQTWHTTPYYDYNDDNNSATIKAKDGTGADLPSLQSPEAKTAAIVVSWNEVPDVNGRQVTHYEVQRETNPWVTVAEKVTGTTYVDTDVAAGDTRRYRIRAVNDRAQKGPWSAPMEATAAEVETRTITEFRDRVVTRTETVVETVTVGETPYAYFAEEEFTRTVAENSAPGSPVGAPVTVLRNSGNKVAYSLEGPDAALFTIEQDSGQILVGEGAVLDYESGTTSYTVVVVADPSSGADVRATVTISVVDVSETVFVFIDPSGAPQVGFPLFASLMHTEGDPIEPRWQWQRSMPDGTWADIPGAIQDIYIPTELDAGRRLRALVVFGNPGGDGEGLAGAVTERVPGEAQVIPTAGTGASPEEVFGVLGDNLAAVWLYDNATQTWAVYSPWNPPEVNDLKTVSSGDVVWMDVISEVQFQGKTLYPGWNLIVVN